MGFPETGGHDLVINSPLALTDKSKVILLELTPTSNGAFKNKVIYCHWKYSWARFDSIDFQFNIKTVSAAENTTKESLLAARPYEQDQEESFGASSLNCM